MQKKLRANLMLLIAALIWGSTFVVQTTASDTVEPFTFLFSRSFIGFLFLIPVIAIFNFKNNKNLMVGEQKQTLKPSKLTIVAGVLCGVVLTIASYCQQKGITLMTDNVSGKAGFISALYIVFTPIFGVLLKRKIPKIVVLCVPIATLGFYLLCIKSGFNIELGDILTLISAFFFAFHILIIDYFMEKGADPIKTSCIQFLVVGIISVILAFIFEKVDFSIIWNAKLEILYAGFLSSGIAFTLQMIAQKDADPTSATLIMSLESVFAVISGWLVLGESLSPKELIGCLFVFIAVILAQIQFPQPKSKKDNQK
ncbi:MAG: DMT family transporter [Clostridia bacterium]|nr:DMT family transporter [Clostridia bacterium]